MNTTLTQKEYSEQANLFKVLIHPARLLILDVLRGGEQCVCHLEAYLGYRQAYISQHLIILRASGLVDIRRDGKNIYYQIADSEIFSILDASKAMKGIRIKNKHNQSKDCPCPKCKAKQ
jgi:DNA-binding transcriptional ArsR family regulator